MSSRSDFLNQQFLLVDGDYPGGRVSKHKKMCNSPFVFFRGSAQIFYADIAVGNIDLPAAFNDVPLTTIMGDCHVSNFGFFTEESSHGDSVVFSLNDFDDACIGRAQWDVLRFLLSLELTADHCEGIKNGDYQSKKSLAEGPFNPYKDKQNIEGLQLRHASKAFIEELKQSFENCIADKNGVSTFIDCTLQDFSKPSCLSKRYKKAKARAIGGEEFITKSALAKAVDIGQAPLKFDNKNPKFRQVGSLSDGIKRQLSPYFYHDIIDLVYRVNAGTGSVNMPRLYLLIGPQQEHSIEHCHIVEVKQQRTAAPLYYFADLHAQNTLNPAHLTFKCQRSMQSRHDCYLDEVFFQDEHWLIRSRHHTKLGIDPEHLGFGHKNVAQNGLSHYAEVCAQELAKAYSRNSLSSSVFEQGMIQALDQAGDELIELAANYAQQVKNDWQWLCQQQ